ncbi:MAG: hypothetical protein M1828_004291 [Chrysothrix sp. TS-e1954]|nr:MAG: hypothetical protein M1828_004291 [Chrysothrix sp. TS-e1954]
MAYNQRKNPQQIRPSVSRSTSAPLEPKTDPPQPQTFLFLDSTNEESSAECKRSARSFVMQKARREKPWSTRRQGSPKQQSSPKLKRAGSVSTSSRAVSREPDQRVGRTLFPTRRDTSARSRSPPTDEEASSIVSQCEQCHSTAHAGSRLCQNCTMQSSLILDPLIPSNDHVAPLSNLASQKQEALMSHWLENVCPEFVDIDILHQCTTLQEDCSRLLQDRAAAQAVCCFAAQSLAIQGQATNEDVILYQGQAIAEINNNISIPGNGISDSCIFAVFVLLCLEERCYRLNSSPAEVFQEAQQRTVHLKGLQHMISVRGGINALEDNQALQALIAWHAVADSLLSLTSPWLPLKEWRDSFVYPRVKIFTSDVRPAILRQLLDSATILQRPLATIANDVCYYAAELDEWYTRSPAHIDPIKLQSWGVVLQSRLQEWLENPSLLTQRQASEECLCLALLMFVTKITMTRDRGFDPIHFAILGRLKDALLRSSGHEWSSMPLALVWVLTIGGLCSVGSADESWFATHFRGACQLFSIWTVDEVKSYASQLYWMDTRLHQPLETFWWRSSQELVFEQLEWRMFLGIESLQPPSPSGMEQAMRSTTIADLTPPASETSGHRIAPSPERILEFPDYGIIPDRGAVLGYAFGHTKWSAFLAVQRVTRADVDEWPVISSGRRVNDVVPAAVTARAMNDTLPFLSGLKRGSKPVKGLRKLYPGDQKVSQSTFSCLLAPGHLSTWIQEAASTASNSIALQLSLRALALTKIGRLHEDSNLIIQGQADHVRSLQAIQRCLYDVHTSGSDDTLAACRSVMMFELFESSTGAVDGWNNHLHGLTRLMMLRGPASPSSALAKALVSDIKYLNMIYSVQYGRPSLFRQNLWRADVRETSLSGLEARLTDLGFDLASLLLRLEETSDATRSEDCRLLKELHDSLLVWHEDFILAVPEQTRNDAMHLSELSAINAGEGAATIFRSIYISTAVLRTTYWALMLVLYVEILELQREADQPLMDQWQLLSDEETTRERCVSLAKTTLLVLSQLTNDSMGWYGAQKALFPLYMVQYYLKQYPNDIERDAFRLQNQLKSQRGLRHAQALIDEWRGECFD